MKEYFYQKNGEKVGPHSLNSILYGPNSEQLKNDIQDDTLIWYEGLENWIPAREDDDLHQILSIAPPPIPKNDLGQEANIDQEKNLDFETAQDSPLKPRMFKNLFTFEGRVRRLEFGLSFLVYFFFYMITGAFTAAVPELAIFGLWILPLWWIVIMQGAKRCHDFGFNGWFQLIPFFVLYMIFAKGDSSINKYGYPPK